jgi:hypothetical protein
MAVRAALPADLTTPEARETVAAELARYARTIGALRGELAMARDRERTLHLRIEALEDTIDRLAMRVREKTEALAVALARDTNGEVAV